MESDLDIHRVLLDQSFGALQELTSATLESLPSTSSQIQCKEEVFSHSRTFQLDFNCFTDSTLFPDISIHSSDGTLRCAHRIVLSRLGTYVSNLLMDTEQDESPVLVLPDFSSRVVDILLQLAYAGEARLTEADVEEVTHVCALLNVQQDFSVENVENYVDILQRRLTLLAPCFDEREGDETLTNKQIDVPVDKVVDDWGGDPRREVDSTLKQQNVQNAQNAASQCGFCGKTFIYPKSYERHTVDCEKNFRDRESLEKVDGENDDLKEFQVENDERIEEVEMADEAVNESEGLDDPDTQSDEEKQGQRQKELFKFVHYEKRGDLYFCTFPGCDYIQGQKSKGGCKNHQLRHHATDQEKIFSCKFCPDRFATNQLRNKHQNIAHNKRFPCQTCGKIFSERSRLFIHSRIHTGEKPFVCEECGFSCAQRDNLRLHKQFKHPGGRQNKKFNCDMCEASFLTKSNLTRHRMTHTSLKDYVCETCGKAFKDSGALKQHNFSHGSADFVCSQCHMRFTSPLYLSRHMDRKHPMDGVQPFTCGVCARGFPLNYQLQEHIQAVHENVKHCCPHCDLAIGRRSSVHRHIKKGRCPVQSRLQFLSSDSLVLPITTVIHL